MTDDDLPELTNEMLDKARWKIAGEPATQEETRHFKRHADRVRELLDAGASINIMVDDAERQFDGAVWRGPSH